MAEISAVLPCFPQKQGFSFVKGAKGGWFAPQITPAESEKGVLGVLKTGQ